MKNIFFFMALCLAPAAFAGTTAQVNEMQQVLDTTHPGAVVRLGTKVTQERVYVARARYSFAVQGGSSLAVISLTDDEGKPFKLPNKAVIRDVLIDVQTTVTSVGTSFISFGVNSSNDLKSGANYSGFTATSLIAGIPVGTAATAVKLTADRTVSMTIGAVNLTAGKFVVLITYVLSQ